MLSRRDFLRRSGAAIAVAPFLSAASFFPSTAASFETLRRGVGTFTQRGGTIGWLVRDGALVVVDTQSPESAEACWAGLQERSNRSMADLVINTHHHGDHTGGNPVFAEYTDRLVAHQNSRVFQQRSAEQSDSMDSQVFPNETYDGSWSADVGDETVRLHYYGPGHTGGDSVVHFERANVVHMGDLVFNRVYPFIDIPGGASTVGWIDTLEQVHADFTDDTIFIFGHGASAGITGNREDLLAMRDFLYGLLEYVETQTAEGASLEEMSDREVLPGLESHNADGWPIGLAGCIRAVYREQLGTAE